MPWAEKAHEGGFTSGAPWLPVPDYHLERAVDRQEGDANSVLAFARHVIATRRQHPGLVTGDIRFVEANGDAILAFEREGEGKYLCVFNLSRNETGYELPAGAGEAVLSAGAVDRGGNAVKLGPRAGLVLKL
jgi:alpha-glucosidase